MQQIISLLSPATQDLTIDIDFHICALATCSECTPPELNKCKQMDGQIDSVFMF